jgi:plasmid stabilization system protein ParE
LKREVRIASAANLDLARLVDFLAVRNANAALRAADALEAAIRSLDEFSERGRPGPDPGPPIDPLNSRKSGPYFEPRKTRKARTGAEPQLPFSVTPETFPDLSREESSGISSAPRLEGDPG